MLDWILNLIVSFAGVHPAFGTVLMIIGLLRVVVKPVMSLLVAYVKWSPSVKDDSHLDTFMKSELYSGIVYVLDWFASIKLPKK